MKLTAVGEGRMQWGPTAVGEVGFVLIDYT